MPIGHLANAVVVGSARTAKRAERPKVKDLGQAGKDFAFFIPFFLTEKKSGKKARSSEKR